MSKVASKVAKVVAATAPKSWKDTLIRTIKTGVVSIVTAVLAAGVFNVKDWKAYAMAASNTALTALLNVILAWGNSP